MSFEKDYRPAYGSATDSCTSNQHKYWHAISWKTILQHYEELLPLNANLKRASPMISEVWD
eukprot:3864226-Amphidinium_carterae.1